jgi:glycine C-acetyltransferase
MHSLEDVEITLKAFKEVHKKLVAGEYRTGEVAKVDVDM